MKKDYQTSDAPNYRNLVTALEIFLFLKDYPNGQSVNIIKEKYFPDKSDVTFRRIIRRAFREFLFDQSGDPVFLFDGKGNSQFIRLHPKHFSTPEDIKWSLVGILFSNALMANIKGDLDSSPEIKNTIQNLRDKVLLQYENDKLVKNPEIATEENKFSKKLKLKYFSKKVGFKSYGKDSGSTSILDTVTDALHTEEKIEITYNSRSKNKKIKVIVLPYTLLEYNNAFYILGPQEGKRGVRILPIDRIEKAKRLRGKTFKYPAGYNPEKLLSNGFGVGDFDKKSVNVKLQFEKEISYLILERHWHNTQKISKDSSGHIVLEMQVPEGYELVEFILKFGNMVKVLEPASLKNLINERKK